LKKTGKNTTITVVANAELPQSKSAQETVCLFQMADFIFLFPERKPEFHTEGTDITATSTDA
jgi:hypothetical protein